MDTFSSRARFVILFAAGVVVFLGIVWTARAILLLLFAAILGALMLTTVAGWAHARLRIPRGVALTLVVVLAVGLAALGIRLRGPEIAEQFSQLQIDLPVAAHRLLPRLNATGWGRLLVARYRGDAGQLSGLTYAITRIGGIVLTTVTTVTGFIIVCVAGLYFAAEPDAYLEGLRLVTPRVYRAALDRCLGEAARMLRWWLLAKALSMFAVGLLISTGLWILGIPLAGTLGVIAALLTFIPNVGPILSAAPAGLLAFTVSPAKGVVTLLLFFAVHFVEGNFITPLAERRIVKLLPGLTLAVQLFLAFAAGALGIALAAPLTAAAVGIVAALRQDDTIDLSRGKS